jgi:hypothetical protein
MALRLLLLLPCQPCKPNDSQSTVDKRHIMHPTTYIHTYMLHHVTPNPGGHFRGPPLSQGLLTTALSESEKPLLTRQPDGNQQPGRIHTTAKGVLENVRSI